jgi:hypothetical protein
MLRWRVKARSGRLDMTKRLMIGLLTGVLMATLLPGVAVAKDKEDTSACKKGDWAEWVRTDGTAFADQGECVSYVAEGGTLSEPTDPPDSTFESVCADDHLGSYSESYQYDVYMTLTPACLWEAIDQAAWESARADLVDLCTTSYSWPPYWSVVTDEGLNPIFFGCTEAT